MRASCKRNVLGIMMDAVDYGMALDVVFEAAGAKRGCAISALAVHGLMTGTIDRAHLRLVQTPQAFGFVALLDAHRLARAVGCARGPISACDHA